jgi:hypothetical protein
MLGLFIFCVEEFVVVCFGKLDEDVLEDVCLTNWLFR